MGSSRGSRALKNSSDLRNVLLPLFVVIFSIILLVSPHFLSSGIIASYQTTPSTLRRDRSGLVAMDNLTSGNLANWNMKGDAISEHAPYKYFENSSGLTIGVQANKSGEWAGFFAESPSTLATLFHARLTLRYNAISNGSFNTGIYVQTAAISNINFVFCGAQAESKGSYWAVLSAKGTPHHATNYTVLYSTPIGGTPLTQDCTIVTNGNNSLRVYLGGNLVYSNQSMDLDVPPPFNVYLEAETTNAQKMLFGTYSDYYANSLGSLSITGAPPSGTVKIVNSSEDEIALSQVSLNGTAMIPLGAQTLPLNGTIDVYDSNGNLTASTHGSVLLWGGDVYSVPNSTTTAFTSSNQSSTSTRLVTSTFTHSSTSSSNSTSASNRFTQSSTSTSTTLGGSSKTIRSSSITTSSNNAIQKQNRSTSSTEGISTSTTDASAHSISSVINSETLISSTSSIGGPLLDSMPLIIAVVISLGGIVFLAVRKPR